MYFLARLMTKTKTKTKKENYLKKNPIFKRSVFVFDCEFDTKI